MGKYVINGGYKLDGKIKIESAKNAVLPILAASILKYEAKPSSIYFAVSPRRSAVFS